MKVYRNSQARNAMSGGDEPASWVGGVDPRHRAIKHWKSSDPLDERKSGGAIGVARCIFLLNEEDLESFYV